MSVTARPDAVEFFDRYQQGADTADQSSLVLPSQFLLRRHADSWQIVAYLNSTDLAAVFAQRTGRSQPRDAAASHDRDADRNEPAQP
jgi:hypothetical protein